MSYPRPEAFSKTRTGSKNKLPIEMIMVSYFKLSWVICKGNKGYYSHI